VIFKGSTVILTKWQLVALFEIVYQGEDRENLAGLFVDFGRKRMSATDGHRLVIAGELPVPDLHLPPSETACYLPRAKVEAALKLAKPTSGIVIERLDDEARIWIVRKMLYKGKWAEQFARDPEPYMEEEATEVVVIDKPKDPRTFPPLQQVTPVLDFSREQGVAVAGFGARYLAAVATIARSIESTIAGGTTCRILMPKKHPLDPVTFYLDDLTLGAWWVYVIMPHRT
jgi:hypothetical protein